MLARWLSQSLQLIRAANDTSALQHERTSSLVERVASLQAPSVEALARGQAAQLVLRSAGLDPHHNTQGQSSAVVISRDANGQVQVLPLEASKVQAITAAASTTQTTITTTASVTSPDVTPGEYPLFQKFCANCHGVGSTDTPGGGFYIGDDATVAAGMRSRWHDITTSVGKDKTMPKPTAPQPTDQERAGILNELDAMISKNRVTAKKG